jgi:poly(A) polymerase
MFTDQLKKLRAWVIREPVFRILQQTADRLGSACFLTGGLVRDSFLGRPTQDIDLAVSRRAMELARDFAQTVQGTFVLLKEDQDTARVILPGLRFDFAGFRASNLLQDLNARDFTINSIALPLAPAFGPDPWERIDPLNGAGDLARRIIRQCGPNSFNQDSLRLLRAYRLGAQLGMEIEPETRGALKTWGPSLNRAAPERQLYEWIQLLAQPAAAPTLSLMDEDGILEILFPELIALKNTPQNGFHHANVFDHSLLAFEELEQFPCLKTSPAPELIKAVDAFCEKGEHWPYLKWTTLVHDLGKPAAAELRDYRWTFHDHDRLGRELFHQIAGRFRLGHQSRDYMTRLIGWHMRPFHLLQEESNGKLTPKATLRLVREINEDLDSVFLLAWADCRAARGPDRPPDLEDRLIRLWQEARRMREEILIPQENASPLVTGEDLIQLGLIPGPLFQKILLQIKEERWSGEIMTREEALAWIREGIEKKRWESL